MEGETDLEDIYVLQQVRSTQDTGEILDNTPASPQAERPNKTEWARMPENTLRVLLFKGTND